MRGRWVREMVLCIWVLTAGTALGQINFKPKRSLFKVDNPRHIIHGDLDGNGRLDIVAVKEINFSVLLNGSLGFSEPEHHVVDNKAIYGMATADFDGDHDIDLAAICQDSVFILFNAGNAKFPSKKKYLIGGSRGGIVTGDFNGDGLADLAVTNLLDNNVSVLLNSPSGFLPQVKYDVGTALEIVSADFNQDGKPDLAVANRDQHSFAVLVNLGNGSFQNAVTYSTRNYPAGLAAADYDNDGKVDIAVGFSDGLKMSVFRNSGSSFSLQAEYDVGSNNSAAGFIRSGDFDGTLGPDIALLHYDTQAVRILLNDGSGNFAPLAPPPILLTTHPLALDIADFDLNGKQDIVLTTDVAGVNIRYNAGGNVFVGPERGDGYPVSVAKADFNGDGKLDLAAADFNSKLISVMLNDGDGNFSRSQICPAGNQPYHLQTADVTGDGIADIVNVNVYDGTVSLIKGVGDGNFSPQLVFSAGSNPVRVLISDLDNDTKPDLIIVNSGNLGVSILKNNGAGFNTPNHVNTDNISTSVAVGDLTADGLPDLLIGGTKVAMLINQGSMVFSSPVYFPTTPDIGGVAIGDFSFDNVPDIAYTQSDRITILPNNGNATFGTAIVKPAGPSSNDIQSGDFNGDGRKDIVVQNGSQGVSILLAQNTVDYKPPVSFLGGGNVFSMTTGNFDSDNRNDFAIVGETDIYLTVFKSLPAMSIVLHDTSRAYGYPNPQFKSTVTGWQGVGSPIITYSSPTDIRTGVGSYSFDAIPADTIANNYSVTKAQGILVITKAPLKITARDTVRSQGSANPPFRGTVEGIRNNDIINVSYSTTAMQTSPLGDFPISPSLSFTPNYEPTLINGTLHVQLPTGIEDSFSEGLYPNPSEGNIVLTNLTATRCSIADCMGREVARLSLVLGDNKLELNLPPGLYLMRMDDGQVRKIIIR